MLEKISYLFLLLVLAFWFAKVEIQIEGTDGWAKNLPTWKFENHWALKIFFGGRAMTGYHAWVLSFIFLIFHLPVCFATPWSWALESRVLGGFMIFWILEDFLWFVVNPGFGISKFKKQYISWHPRWIWLAPIEYWIFLPLGGLLIFLS